MKWFEHKITEVRGRWMPAPYQNIFIGSDPRDGMTKKVAKQFKAIVNVSCTEGALFEPAFPEQRTYWYPVNEMGQWSYAYFIMMFKIIDHHYRKGDKIYIHCHAGAYRSPSIFEQWLIACENKTPEQAMLIEAGKDYFADDPSMRHYSTYQNYILGNLPPDYQEFVARIRHKGIKEANLTGILFHPEFLNRTPQVRTKRHKELADTLKYNALRPWRYVKGLYTDAKDAFLRWKNDQIKIKPEKWMTYVTDDWAKKSKKRPPRKKS